jgi:hypothetical protein
MNCIDLFIFLNTATLGTGTFEAQVCPIGKEDKLLDRAYRATRTMEG